MPWSIDPVTRYADATRAYQIARNHVDQVREAVTVAKAEGAKAPWLAAVRETEFRAATIAATETASAASSERLDAALDVQQTLGVMLLKEWNAEGDACPVCAGMDGEIVPLDGSFSNGSIPGAVHPNCRCWPEILIRENSRAA